MHRRHFLTLSAIPALATLPELAAVNVPLAGRSTAYASSSPRPGGSRRFAVVTDTHATPEAPDRLDWMSRVFDSIADKDPAFVANCGDITEYGGDEEYASYLSTIPEALRPRVRHVPGNHEARWDVAAKRRYHELFGPTPFSFEVGGLRVLGLDPTVLLQEPGRFGTQQLRWLTTELRRSDTPTICFLHYPMGADSHYVDDQNEFFEAVSGSPLRGIFAGHIHTNEVHRVNAITQIAGDDVKTEPVYYLVDIDSDALRVTEVRLEADDERSREVTEIGLRPSRDRRPRGLRATVHGDRLRVRATLPGNADGAAQVSAQLYPRSAWGRKESGSWTTLRPRGSTVAGELDLRQLPPGRHLVRVRAEAPDGAMAERTVEFTTKVAEGPRVRWERRMPGMVQAPLAAGPELVIVADTEGTVDGLTAGGERRWRRTLGPVYGGAAFSADERLVVVACADGTTVGLDSATGDTRWSFRASEPFLASPCLVTPGGGRDETVLVAGGSLLYALDARDGKRLWSADLHGLFAGRVACDGETVFAGGGDGRARAFALADGSELWSVPVTDRTDTYGRLLYGPWASHLRLLPDGLVLVGTVAAGLALRTDTGVVGWQRDSSYMYTPATVLESGEVLVIDEWGEDLALLDGATGEQRWVAAPLGSRPLNAGPVVRDGAAWLVTSANELVRIDLDSGQLGDRLSLGPSWCYATPALQDDVLVTADHSGVVRGIRLP